MKTRDELPRFFEILDFFFFQQDSFEMYVEYCQHKETAQRFLSTPSIKHFFDVSKIDFIFQRLIKASAFKNFNQVL